MKNALLLLCLLLHILPREITSFAWPLDVYRDHIQKNFRSEPLHSYEVIKPVMSDAAQSKMSKENTKQVGFSAFGRNFKMNLLNRKALFPPKMLLSLQQTKSKHKAKIAKDCFYQGNLIDDANSSVTLSTCEGKFSGFIRTGNGEEFMLDQISLPNTKRNKVSKINVLYKRKDVFPEKVKSCKTKVEQNKILKDFDAFSKLMFPNLVKVPFDDSGIIGGKKYIEAVLIMDNREFKKYGVTECISRGTKIMSYVDGIYKSMNTRIALTEVIIWNKKDEIVINENGDGILGNIESYVENTMFRKMKIKADVVILLTGLDFPGSSVGFATVGSLCTGRSAVVVQDYSSGDPFTVANTLAHELGHAVGLVHTKSGCKCPGVCVMGAWGEVTLANAWTDCAQKAYEKLLSSGVLSCLNDYPYNLFGDPVCGNGYVERGEDCDCGSESDCFTSGILKCCNPRTCKFHPNASCANGPCCENCQTRSSGHLCRESLDKECDTPEYCDGKSPQCPKNNHAKDGSPCDKDGVGNCFSGVCKSHDKQCKRMWGPNAVKGHDFCFDKNLHINDKYANCGRISGGYRSCAEKDKLCGKLQCMGDGLPTFPLIGRPPRGVKIIGSRVLPHCKMASIPYRTDAEDLSLAEVGTKCGKDSACDVNRHCVKIEDLDAATKCQLRCHDGDLIDGETDEECFCA